MEHHRRTYRDTDKVERDVIRRMTGTRPEDLETPMRPPNDLGPTTVYYLHTADHQLLYVGITLSSKGLERMQQHAADKDWWNQVAYASMEHVPTRAKAEQREALAIRELSPRYNKVQPAIANTYNEFGVRMCACGCRAAAPNGRRYSGACAQRMSRERLERQG